MDLRLSILCQSAVYSGLLNHCTLNRFSCCAMQLFEWIASVLKTIAMRKQDNG